MIFIVVKFQVKPEWADRWVELVTPFTEATRAEPGNLWFEWSRSIDDPACSSCWSKRSATATRAPPTSTSAHFATAMANLPQALVATPKIISQTVPAGRLERAGRDDRLTGGRNLRRLIRFNPPAREGPPRRTARRAPPTRAARRWRTAPCRCRRGGRRARRSGVGTVAIVQSRASTTSTSSHVMGVETVAVGQPPHRVGRGHRVVAGVLVVVDEQRGGVPVLAPPGRGHLGRRPPLDLAGEGQRGAAQVAEAERRLDADVDVQPVAARRLRPADRTELVEHLVDDPGHPPDPLRRAVAASGRGRSATRRASRRQARREFQGWNSTVDICTAQITWASSVTHSSSACWP